MSDVIKKIQENLNLLEQLSEKDLVRQQELGDQLSFQIGKPEFEKIFDLFMPLKDADLSSVSLQILSEFNSQLESAVSKLGGVLKFNAKHTNPAQLRDSLINEIKNAHHSCFQSVIPIYAYINFQNHSKEDPSKQVSTLMGGLLQEKRNLENSGREMLNEIQNILERSRQAVGELGVAQFSKIFQEESKRHAVVARRWLIASICVMVVLVCIGSIFLFFSKYTDSNTPYLIHLAVTKLLVITVLFYALNLCSKNYKSHTHNSILNKHRQNALNTFETFVKSSEGDSQTKNAVLLEATRTIFSNQQTGYLNNENEGEFPSRIIEIIKSNKE